MIIQEASFGMQKSIKKIVLKTHSFPNLKILIICNSVRFLYFSIPDFELKIKEEIKQFIKQSTCQA